MSSLALTLAISSLAAKKTNVGALLRNGSQNWLGRTSLKDSSKTGGRCGLCCKAELSELAPAASAASAAYGFLLLGGGLFAYSRSGSKGSLFGGLTGSVLMASAYFLMKEPDTRAVGDAIGFGSAFLFSSVFGIRLAASHKLFPAGPLLLVSISALALFVLAYMHDSLPA